MIIMGSCGVLDHSGIRLGWRGVYATADHDEHHRLYNVNYAFPFPFMDVLHRTYHAPRAIPPIE
jgi:sterol desaturase/sphingolipid hydroxylase (fatty acid hydroxylase superfamily)